MPSRSVFLRVAAAAVLGLGLPGCAMLPGANVDEYEATLSGAQEVPPAQTVGTGRAEVRYHRNTSMLSWRVTYSGLTGPLAAAHIHGPAGPGQNAGILVPFTNVGSSPFSGEARLTPEQVNQLNAGQWYVNLHTARYPGGEIRGQLLRRR